MSVTMRSDVEITVLLKEHASMAILLILIFQYKKQVNPLC